MMSDQTLYVVSGFMRTGTSMMMHALEIGGMETAYRQSRDVMKNRYADEHYDPNLGGLYELEPRDYREWNFPIKFKGKLIKALNMSVPHMAVMPAIRVIFMRRDQEEIRQSYLAFFNKNLGNIERLDEQMEGVLERIRNRRDVISLHVFWYRDVIEHPLEHFSQLVSFGWPIQASAAAKSINPALCRFRIENLTVGII